MPIALVDLLDERQVALGLSANQQPAALREIVQLLAANGKIDDAEKFLGQLIAREQTRPSAVEYDVVFPHLRTDLVHQIVLGIGRSKAGVAFGGGETANLIFVIGVPHQSANEYLVAVGALARILKDEEIREALMRATIAAEMIEILRRAAA
jgi:mannitol/fructose-specific phosphotransferase system IIA component (Ntr-type)